LNVSKLKFFLK